MQYETQKLAYPYFIVALALFVAQVLFGVLAGTVYVLPNFLSEAIACSCSNHCRKLHFFLSKTFPLQESILANKV